MALYILCYLSHLRVHYTQKYIATQVKSTHHSIVITSSRFYQSIWVIPFINNLSISGITQSLQTRSETLQSRSEKPSITEQKPPIMEQEPLTIEMSEIKTYDVSYRHTGSLDDGWPNFFNPYLNCHRVPASLVSSNHVRSPTTHSVTWELVYPTGMASGLDQQFV